MKHLKILSFAAIAAAALMAFAASASATELTSPAGVMVTTGTTIEAASEGHAVLDSSIGTIECNSTVKGTTLDTGVAPETVEVKIETLTFTNCTNGAVVTVLQRAESHPTGTLTIHTQETNPNNNGTLTSFGTEVKISLGGLQCIYLTQNTDIGTLTGSSTTGSTATFDISGRIPEFIGGPLCGASASWTGSYKVTNPDFVNVI